MIPEFPTAACVGMAELVTLPKGMLRMAEGLRCPVCLEQEHCPLRTLSPPY